jgi:hypothetical protein
MADVLDARLRQAQSEHQSPIDLVSALGGDELLRRQDLLISRRLQQARFRDADRSLDTLMLTSTMTGASSSATPPPSPRFWTVCCVTRRSSNADLEAGARRCSRICARRSPQSKTLLVSLDTVMLL